MQNDPRFSGHCLEKVWIEIRTGDVCWLTSALNRSALRTVDFPNSGTLFTWWNYANGVFTTSWILTTITCQGIRQCVTHFSLIRCFTTGCLPLLESKLGYFQLRLWEQTTVKLQSKHTSLCSINVFEDVVCNVFQSMGYNIHNGMHSTSEKNRSELQNHTLLN